MHLKRILAVAALLSLATLARAEDRPNTLTPKEISDGWVLLFDGETMWGWKVPEGPVTWSVVDGTIQANGNGESQSISTTSWGDFELKFEVKPELNGKWQSISIPRASTSTTVSSSFRVAAGEPVKLIHTRPGTFQYRNIKLRPLGLKSIFNGKDLTGWNVIPDHKSVFTVTPEGWLNVKNGNGDIQTDKSWGDLVLQLDVYSNGDHLNSGVFFRANKGQFWSGYEAQIRNQWEGDDRTKAVDYGTGAIYNRQAARRVVSSDREWFKMTIVAHGYHLATWVNGYQVADFMDQRLVDETNARKGARKAPGVISIQGHDPTTDLSFKNIRIAEMPAEGK